MGAKKIPKKVIILGGGIGGLTVAHELSRRKELTLDIHIYEKKDVIGGMARSGFKDRAGVKLPTEYSWRIYGPNYTNLREILKQIPLKDNASKSVHDNLINIHDYLIADQNTVFYMNNSPKTLLDIHRGFEKVPFYQKLSVARKILYGFMICTERLNTLDKFSWAEYIDPDHSLCHDMKKYIIDIMGPYLGAEVTKVNVPSVVKTLESFKMFNRPNSVMDEPTSEAWFTHWQSYLESQGVTFHFNTAVVDVHTENNIVKNIILENTTKISGDIFFCSLPVESVARLPSLKIPGIHELAQRAHQLMVGMQLYFDTEIILPNKNKNTAMYIPDSPWQLVIEPQGAIWNIKYEGIADYWSIGLCDPTRDGLLFNKPFIECSHEEIKEEVWHQIKISSLNKYLNLDKVKVTDYNVWESYIFNNGKLHTNEPKFSSNKGTYFLRPDNKTEFENLYFATAYTKTEVDMFEMESAAESGRRAAQMIEKSIRVVGTPRPLFFAPYRWLDALLSKLNLYQHSPILLFCLGLPLLIICLPFLLLIKLKRLALP
jgi:hypothetical protein